MCEILVLHLVDHDSDDESQQSSTPATATNIEAWEVEYNKWVQTPTEDIDDEASQVEWWEANGKHIGPTWTSIAQNILPIMASSVSSERAFSAGGLTITDWQNRLHGDVEALQILKSLFKEDDSDAIFKQTHSSALESDCSDCSFPSCLSVLMSSLSTSVLYDCTLHFADVIEK
ncbi:hat family dimerization domain-containing protein [Moniliophthora roreri]|nr:hat family dimerization domain-containing protein [Moniliophthora roreri]